MKQNSPIDPLSQEDFFRLKQNPQPYSRAAVARKISTYFDSVEPASTSYQLAMEISLYLQKDTSDYVRVALANSVCHSKAAPKKLIYLLANDTSDEVAVPVLRESPILQDDELIELVKNTESPLRLIAVAERKILSVSVTSVVAEKGYEKVASILLSNQSAQIAEDTYICIARLHPKSNLLLQKMMARIPMPLKAVEMMKHAANNGGNNLSTTKGVKSFSASARQELKNLALSIMLLGEIPGESACIELATQFQQSRKINASVLLMVLCHGQLGLFLACLAVSAEITYEEAEAYHGRTLEEMEVLLQKAGVSYSLWPLIHWIWQGVIKRLEQGVRPGSKQMLKLMSIHIYEGTRKGINFASTIALPIAETLDELL